MTLSKESRITFRTDLFVPLGLPDDHDLPEAGHGDHGEHVDDVDARQDGEHDEPEPQRDVDLEFCKTGQELYKIKISREMIIYL